VHTISSRHQLDQCLSSTNHKADIAIGFKDFDNATKFQKSLEQLQEILPSLPSLLELQEQLSKKQKEFDDASLKDFANDALFQTKLGKLKELKSSLLFIPELTQ